MVNGLKTVIVMPAYNAAATIEKTFFDIPEEFRSSVILVDDGSTDETILVALALGITVIRHDDVKSKI